MNGWKDIAAYLDRAVRTVQRWEKEMGLPVRRLGAPGGESVYALPEEIDRWLLTASGGQATSAPAHDEEQRERTGEPKGQPQVAPRPRMSRRVLLTVGVLAIVAALVAVAVWSMPGHQPPAGVRRAAQPGVAVIDGKLMAFGDAGRLLWSKPFDPATLATDPAVGKQRIAVDDVDGDGRDEVLVVSDVESPDAPLYCFNEDASLRFAFRVPRAVEYRETKNNDDPIPPVTRRYHRPFTFNRVFVAPGASGRKTVWAIATHSPYFPSVLLQMHVPDEGDPVIAGEYWSPGHIIFAKVVSLGGRYTVLVGASYNESRGGSLSVFFDRFAQGAPPTIGGDKQCLNCPAGLPDAFFVFPRSPLLHALNGNAAARFVDSESDHGFTVSVSNASGPVPGGYTHNLYTFDSSLAIVDAQIVNDYSVLLDRLQREGTIPRPFRPYADADLFPVLKWNGQAFDEIAGPTRR